MNNLQRLSLIVDEALFLMGKADNKNIAEPENGIVSPSLLDKCISLCEQGVELNIHPIRTIHHLSCTGGTLFAKCIAAMPNILLLNEVDPLSKLMVKRGSPPFTPTDMISLLRQGDPKVTDEFITKLFIHNLDFVREEQSKIGRSLVLRDHSHGHFLIGNEVGDRPTLRDMIKDEFQVRSVVTVRDPIDSYLSMKAEGWHKQFVPATFDEYCMRYIQFLQRYEGVEVIRYEDLVTNPHKTMQRICQLLSLNYFELFDELFDIHEFSGDSGRKSGIIEMRPRQSIDDAMFDEIVSSNNYSELVGRLEYESLSH